MFGYDAPPTAPATRRWGPECLGQRLGKGLCKVGGRGDSRRGRDAGGQRHGVGGAYTRGEGAAGSGQGRDPRQGRVGPAQDHRRGAHMKAATL